MQFLFTLLVAPALAGSFTDDKKVEHKWEPAKPTILISATDALSLIHFGLGSDQLHSVFGEHSTSGSNYGGVYSDGNAVEHGDHANAEFDPSHWPAHPTEDEMKIIKGALDLSPSCSASNYWCAELDMTILDSKGWPDVIIQGPYGGSYAYTADFLGNATERGIPVVIIERSDSYGDNPIPRGYIEVTQRMEELAIALGAEGEAVAADIAKEKAAFCTAAANFKQVAKEAADRGVRALAGYFPYGPVNEDGKSIYGFLAGPPADLVLLMLEELGMQILHTQAPDSWEYNSHMFPDNLTSLAPGRPAYAVDLFLADIRVWLDVTSDSFASAWPHPAITAGQIGYWPSGGHVHSYQHATATLDTVGAVLAKAQKLDETATTCTQVEVISSDTHRSTGIGPAEYACYNPVEYAWCEGFESSAVLASVGLMLAAWA